MDMLWRTISQIRTKDEILPGNGTRYHNCSVSKGHKAPETPLCCIIEIEEVNIKIHGTKNEYQAITPEDVLTGSGMVYP